MIVRTIYGEEEIVTKKCLTCGEEKPLSEYGTSKARSHNSCKACVKKNKKAVDELKKTINFSHDVQCQICGRKKEEFGNRYGGNPFCVDHDHDTGELRGIICMDCNTGLSRFNDDAQILRFASKYITKWQNKKKARKYIMEIRNGT